MNNATAHSEADFAIKDQVLNRCDDSAATIATAVDYNYIPYLQAMLTSLSASNPQIHSVHVLFPDNDRRVAEAVARMAKIFPSKIFPAPVSKESLAHYPIHGRGSVANYLRMAIPDKIKADKVLYLDCDLIVRRHLGWLLNINMRNQFVAAVPDQELRNCLRLGMPRRWGYFNSGVMLLNTIKWREDNVAGTAVKIARNMGSKLELWDQDILNLVFEGNWFRLKREWNATSDLFSNRVARSYNLEAVRQPCIVHFTGPSKPKWSQDHPFKEELIKHFKASGATLPKTPIGQRAKRLVKKSANKLVFFKIESWGPFTLRILRKISSLIQCRIPPRDKASHKERDLIEHYTPDMCVKAGIFTGLKYPAFYSRHSKLLPKLFGTYQDEINGILLRHVIKESPHMIVNVGCAEGYFAVGLARALPFSRVFAYDISSSAREACQAMAVLNGTNNLSIESEFTLASLPRLEAGQSGFLLIDIEGDELDLFLEAPAIPEALSDWNILIETHDFIDPAISEMLEIILSESHDLEFISTRSSRAKARSVRRAVGTTVHDWLEIADEKKLGPTEWLWARSRTSGLEPSS